MNILPRKNYYGNDYMDFFNSGYLKETRFMKTDIYEKDNQYKIEIDLPGLKKENILINYENGYLTINATKLETNEIKENYIRKERFYGEIKRSFYIGEKKPQDIKAIFKEGTLTIAFPKEEEPKRNNKIITIEE